jgi:hypothetical protein
LTQEKTGFYRRPEAVVPTSQSLVIMPMTDLYVLASTSPHSLEDISDKVNTSRTHRIVSDTFEGEISIQIKRFPTHHRTTSSDYFERLDRQGITWSIQVQGLSILSIFLPQPEVSPVLIISIIHMSTFRQISSSAHSR